MQNRTVVPQTLSIGMHVVILFSTNAIFVIFLEGVNKFNHKHHSVAYDWLVAKILQRGNIAVTTQKPISPIISTIWQPMIGRCHVNYNLIKTGRQFYNIRQWSRANYRQRVNFGSMFIVSNKSNHKHHWAEAVAQDQSCDVTNGQLNFRDVNLS